jgi:ParB-like chromosome segregation protein Spo0J
MSTAQAMNETLIAASPAALPRAIPTSDMPIPEVGSAGNGFQQTGWNAIVTARLVAGLHPHPLSVRIYGKPTANDELLDSVRKFGVLSPIIVNAGGYVISGTSRHYAAVQCALTEIPSALFTGTALEEELLVIESNRQRVKLPSVIGREFNERFRIEQELARLRQVEGGKKKVPLHSAEASDARDRAARAVNLGRTTAERLGKLVLRAEKFETARHLLEAVDKGELSINAAFQKLSKSESKQPKPCDCPECGETFPSLTKLRKHGKKQHGLEGAELRERMGFEDAKPVWRPSVGAVLYDTEMWLKRGISPLNALSTILATGQSLTELEKERFELLLDQLGTIAETLKAFKPKLVARANPQNPPDQSAALNQPVHEGPVDSELSNPRPRGRRKKESSPAGMVHIDELPPEARARVMAQIEPNLPI